MDSRITRRVAGRDRVALADQHLRDVRDHLGADLLGHGGSLRRRRDHDHARLEAALDAERAWSLDDPGQASRRPAGRTRRPSPRRSRSSAASRRSVLQRATDQVVVGVGRPDDPAGRAAASASSGLARAAVRLGLPLDDVGDPVEHAGLADDLGAELGDPPLLVRARPSRWRRRGSGRSARAGRCRASARRTRGRRSSASLRPISRPTASDSSRRAARGRSRCSRRPR